MQLEIDVSNDIDLTEFMPELLKIVKKTFRAMINVDKLSIRDDKLNQVAHLTVARKLSSVSVIKTAIEGLEWKQISSTRYEIGLSNTQKLYGSSDTLKVLVKLIEYGTPRLPPLYFFRDGFKEISNNVQQYYDAWRQQ